MRGDVSAADNPVAATKERLWSASVLHAESSPYIVPGAFELRGDLDPGRLSRAVAALPAQHPSLRLAYVYAGGG